MSQGHRSSSPTEPEPNPGNWEAEASPGRISWLWALGNPKILEKDESSAGQSGLRGAGQGQILSKSHFSFDIPGTPSGNKFPTCSASLRSCLPFMSSLQEAGAFLIPVDPGKSGKRSKSMGRDGVGWFQIPSSAPLAVPSFSQFSSCWKSPCRAQWASPNPRKIRDQPGWNYPGGSRGFNEAPSGIGRGLWWAREDFWGPGWDSGKLQNLGSGSWKLQILRIADKKGILVVEITTFPLARREFHVGMLENVHSQISGFGFPGPGKRWEKAGKSWESLKGTSGSRKMGFLLQKSVPRARSRHRGISLSAFPTPNRLIRKMGIAY